MTDYEIAMLFLETLNTVNTHFMNLVSIVSAFLLVAYFGAQLLTRLMVCSIITLYSVVMFYLSFSAFQEMSSFTGLIIEIRARIAGGSEALAWHAAQHAPDFTVPLGPSAIMTVMIMSYAASLIFFFDRRRTSDVNPSLSAS